MADVKETLLTAEGLKKLEDELAYYKSVRRIEVSQRIKQLLNTAISAKTMNMMMLKMNRLSLKVIFLS